MLDKEECKQALEELTKWCDGGYFRYYQEYYETLQQLIKEHFELINLNELLKSAEKFYTNETYFAHIIKAISTCNDEEVKDYAIHCLSYLKNQLDEVNNPQSYKFEDLKPNMWVWDDVNEDCIQIAKINEYGGIYWYGALTEYEADKFKENRFFPVTKAMQYQG